MNTERKFFERLYLRHDGTPRNSSPLPEPIEVDQEQEPLFISQHDFLELRSENEAFKSTQKKFAVGVVAVVGMGVNIIDPPSNVGEFVLNFVPPAVVQSIAYMSFKNGLRIMRNTWLNKTNN